MVTISDLIKNNLPNDNLTYGDILNDNLNVNSNVDEILDPINKEIYYKIKNTDKQRMLLNENKNRIDQNKISPRNVYVGGVGEITQIC